MRHLPLFAQLSDRLCLVVGGGTVAERRVALLLEAGARVRVVAPALTDGLAALAADGRIAWFERPFAEDTIEDCWLIVAATDDRGLNARVASAATAAKRFCNVVDDPALCSFVMPAIVDRGPVTIAVGTGGRSPVLARWIKGLIETALPTRLGALAELAGRWRPLVREAVPDSGERRRFWQSIIDGEVAEHVFAGRDAAADAALDRALALWAADAAASRPGEAYLVGAGPGSPDLLTIRGRQLLAAADVVLYDRLVGAEILKLARREAELICVGKTPHRPSITQKQLNRLLVGLVESGKRVCRLKGGDPMVFGRGGEELEALVNAGLTFQVVPGISAAAGCAAYAGIPLTLRGVSQAVVLTTAHSGDSVGGELGRPGPGQTLALYMGVARYAELSAQLIEQGHDADTPVAIVENGTTDRQRVIRTALGRLADAQAAYGVKPPALLLVGETTRLAERYSWFAPGTLEVFAAEPSDGLARASS